MKHKTGITPDGTIEVHIIGKMTDEDSLSLIGELKDQISKVKVAGKAKVLTNYTHAGKHNKHHTNFLENLHTLELSKVASYCMDRLPARITQDLIKLKGSQERFKLFKTKDEAVSWLLN